MFKITFRNSHSHHKVCLQGMRHLSCTSTILQSLGALTLSCAKNCFWRKYSSLWSSQILRVRERRFLSARWKKVSRGSAQDLHASNRQVNRRRPRVVSAVQASRASSKKLRDTNSCEIFTDGCTPSNQISLTRLLATT